MKRELELESSHYAQALFSFFLFSLLIGMNPDVISATIPLMPTSSINKMPLIVTLLKVEVFLIGGWQLLRGILLWQQSSLLESYDVLINLRFLSIGALLWSGLFLATAVTAQRKNFTLLRRTPLIIILFVIYSICIQLFVNQNLRNPTFWISTIMGYILIIGLNFWLTWRIKRLL